MAKYPYIVNLNGIWYPAGTEVPADADSIKKEQKKMKKSEINGKTTANSPQNAK